ncbi:MAG TPA: lysine--tRNA ligase [Candidatus Saccharimonadales bacterium]|nr:lysine--tRNA ligase [Candidatus Saccharimonadales bacterium]
MTDQPVSKYWLDLAAEAIGQQFPTGDIVISSGISPSASYHIGHFREILTADALAWALRQAGRKVRHLHVVDNFDPLRKRYDFLPPEFENYVGQPICLIPDPIGDCHPTYAEHFFQEFIGYARTMGITEIEIIHSYEDLYKSGRMAKRIEQVLSQADQVRTIFTQTNRSLPPDWTPVQVMDENNIFSNADAKDWDQKQQTIAGVPYDAGRVKLNWRLDWPARWAELGVMVEPFSAQEHGAAGGSYDTGVEFARQIFDITPPIPGARYANIHLIGDTKKMSSSKGNLITPKEALEVMPPEILRYFVVRSRPERTLYFDPGLGLFKLIDEFSQIQSGQNQEFKEAYQFAVGVQTEQVITSVPFNHLVTAYQTTSGNKTEILAILARSGWQPSAAEGKVIDKELAYVKNWLAKYAPAEVKFEVQAKLPKVNLTEPQKAFLAKLADRIADQKQPDAQAIHDAIYEAKGELAPVEAFQTLYQVILGQDHGPRAGWFLASLEHDWLLKRLRLEA